MVARRAAPAAAAPTVQYQVCTSEPPAVQFQLLARTTCLLEVFLKHSTLSTAVSVIVQYNYCKFTVVP